MKKYNNEDYFSVINRNTGKKIVDCAEYSDAMLMFDIDPHNRQIIRNKFVMGPVVDVEIPKALPTNEIVDLGGKWDDPIPEGVDPWNLKGRGNKLPQIKLPEGQGKPIKI